MVPGRLAETIALLGDSLAAYYAEIQRFPLLDHEREIALGQLIEHPNLLRAARRGLADRLEIARFTSQYAEALEVATALAETEMALAESEVMAEVATEHFVCCNLRLVVSFSQYHRRQADMRDLIQEGNLALMRAVVLYDWRAGVRFSTYGARWVRPAIRAAAREQQGVIHIPTGVARQVRQVREAEERLREAGHLALSDGLIAAQMGLDPGRVAELRRVGRTIGSLDEEYIGEDGDPSSYASDLEDGDAAASFEGALADAELREALLRALSDLRSAHKNGPREVLVILIRTGIVHAADTTLQDIGRMIGVSRERARQHERDGFAYLAQHPALRAVFAKRRQRQDD